MSIELLCCFKSEVWSYKHKPLVNDHSIINPFLRMTQQTPTERKIILPASPICTSTHKNFTFSCRFGAHKSVCKCAPLSRQPMLAMKSDRSTNQRSISFPMFYLISHVKWHKIDLFVSLIYLFHWNWWATSIDSKMAARSSFDFKAKLYTQG